MIVSGIPTFIVLLIAALITIIYYFRYKNTWMSHWLVVALVFSLNFFFFAWGVIVFLVGEIIRSKMKKTPNKEL